jgi:hypothetical protein
MAGPDSADFLGSDEFTVLKYLQVLHYGRQGHSEWLGELAHRGRSGGESLNNLASGPVSQRLEDPIKLVPFVKHELKYGTPAGYGQGIS